MGYELGQLPWIFDRFILDSIDRELLHSLERLELKFGLCLCALSCVQVF